MSNCTRRRNYDVGENSLSILDWILTNDKNCVVVAVGFLCLVIDVVGVWALKRRRGAPTNFSIFNLFFASFLAIISHVMKSLKDGHLMPISSPVVCRIWGPFLRLSRALFSFSTMALFCDISNSVKMSQNPRLRVKSFLSVWGLSIIISIPGLDTYRVLSYEMVNGTNSIEDQCQKVNILDSRTLYAIYQGLFALSTSFLPPVYMMTVLYRLRFSTKLLFLFRSIPVGLKKKVRKIRWAFFYACFLFLFRSVPDLFVFVLRLSGKLDFRWRCYEKMSGFELFMQSIFLIQVSLHPLFLLYAQNQLSLWKWMNSFPVLRNIYCTRRRKRKPRMNRAGCLDHTAYNMETFVMSSFVQNNGGRVAVALVVR